MYVLTYNLIIIVIIIICEQKCSNVADDWCGWRTEIWSSLKIIPAMPLPRFERGSSGLPFTYSLYGLLFLVCFKIDILEAIFRNNISIYM